MPVINMDIADLKRLVGDDLDINSFVERVPMMGASVEKVGDDEISVEFFPDRPDLFSIEGVARAFRAFTGKKKIDLSREWAIDGYSGIELSVDPHLLGIRPVIGAAYLTGVNVNEKALISIMNLQEKLHITVGRKRKKVAIGIHDASPLEPPFKYHAALPGEIRFVPLQKKDEWDLERILKEHEKGVDHAWILDGFDRYPVITDSKGDVLSFPPIINGELTRVGEETKDIFIDCTGWDLNTVSLAVNIICAQLMDRGGKLHSVRVIYPDEEGFRKMGLTTGEWPKFEWTSEQLDLEWARSWLGKNLNTEDVKISLARMGFERIEVVGSRLKCLVPPWRGDILHQADIAEDLAIGMGFESFEGSSPLAVLTGKERELSTMTRSLRDTLIGLGFLEVRTISLTNEESQFGLMGRGELEHVRITNPITTEHTMIRLSSFPSLMNILRANKHRDLPQMIFETADVMVENRTTYVLSGMVEDNKASFTGIKGIVQRILSDLELEYELEPAPLGFYIRGRGAAIYVKGEKKGDRPFPELVRDGWTAMGHFGEIHPRMITAMDLPSPVSGFEMDLDLILNITGR